MSLIKELLILNEAKNHLGETVYSTFQSWKAACRRTNSNVWFDGDQDICNAFIGTRPYKRHETKAIGEWDGAEGSIFIDTIKEEIVPLAKLKPGMKIRWVEQGDEKIGTIVADPKYNGGMRIGGRSVKNIFDQGDTTELTVVKEDTSLVSEAETPIHLRPPIGSGREKFDKSSKDLKSRLIALYQSFNTSKLYATEYFTDKKTGAQVGYWDPDNNIGYVYFKTPADLKKDEEVAKSRKKKLVDVIGDFSTMWFGKKLTKDNFVLKYKDYLTETYGWRFVETVTAEDFSDMYAEYKKMSNVKEGADDRKNITNVEHKFGHEFKAFKDAVIKKHGKNIVIYGDGNVADAYSSDSDGKHLGFIDGQHFEVYESSMLGKSLDRALSKQPKLSQVQVQRNKDRWSKREQLEVVNRSHTNLGRAKKVFFTGNYDECIEYMNTNSSRNFDLIYKDSGRLASYVLK